MVIRLSRIFCGYIVPFPSFSFKNDTPNLSSPHSMPLAMYTSKGFIFLLLLVEPYYSILIPIQESTVGSSKVCSKPNVSSFIAFITWVVKTHELISGIGRVFSVSCLTCGRQKKLVQVGSCPCLHPQNHRLSLYPKEPQTRLNRPHHVFPRLPSSLFLSCLSSWSWSFFCSSRVFLLSFFLHSFQFLNHLGRGDKEHSIHCIFSYLWPFPWSSLGIKLVWYHGWTNGWGS